jgi:hypothetical protein
MLKGLNAPIGALPELFTIILGISAVHGGVAVMNVGIASQANIDWLIAGGYRYLVVSRERSRQLDPEQAVGHCYCMAWASKPSMPGKQSSSLPAATIE